MKRFKSIYYGLQTRWWLETERATLCLYFRVHSIVLGPYYLLRFINGPLCVSEHETPRDIRLVHLWLPTRMIYADLCTYQCNWPETVWHTGSRNPTQHQCPGRTFCILRLRLHIQRREAGRSDTLLWKTFCSLSDLTNQDYEIVTIWMVEYAPVHAV